MTAQDPGARNPFRYIAITVLCLIFALPLVVMVMGSLRAPGLAPPEGFEFFPDPLWRFNYRTVFLLVPFWTYLRNSLLVVAVAVPLTVLVASWAGFAIAAAEPAARKRLIALSLVVLMIPVSALWIPRFVLYRWSGVLDTLVPLMAPALMATTPFYVLLFALSYARIPKELFEAARLEGLSPFMVWRRVAWPLARPAAFAIAVLSFIWHWSNFVDPLLYLSDEGNYTVSLGLRALQTLEPANHPILLAASVMATIPPVVAFLAAQRAFFVKTLRI